MSQIRRAVNVFPVSVDAVRRPVAVGPAHEPMPAGGPQQRQPRVRLANPAPGMVL